MNLVIQHPIAYQSQQLRMFLALQDDLGTAWPECSNNALTRLTQASVGAAVHVAEQTSATTAKLQPGHGLDEAAEDDAELLQLQSAESVRMGAVLQSVPKLEGAVTLLREHAEQTGAVGMELSRLAKEVEVTDRELGQPMEIVSSGMLRSGRRSKRLALELSAALNTFVQQYKLCRYEKAAFADRRAALVRRSKERGKADARATQLMYSQQLNRSQMMYGQQQQLYGGMDPAMDAVRMDQVATDAVREADEVALRLKSEVNRVAYMRRTEWHAATKVVASAMKEAVSERVAIWTSVRESFLQAFPEES